MAEPKIHDPVTIAVVVSFNRLALLQKVLPAIFGQTSALSRVIVVDNGSTDGSREYLAGLGPRVDAIFAGGNIGGAGGFATGMAWALELGADYVWLLDDDAVPYNDALESLLASLQRSPQVPFASPMVMDGDGELGARNRPRFTAPSADHWKAVSMGEAAVTTSSFVGPLIRAEAARKTHLPLTDYFIWHDDTEYTARLAKVASGRAVPSAKIAHLVSNPGPDTYVPGRAFYNIRNLAWSARESDQSVMTKRDWQKILLSTVIRQFRAAGLKSFPSVAWTTVKALMAAARRRPDHLAPAQLVHLSRTRDLIPVTLGELEEGSGSGHSA